MNNLEWAYYFNKNQRIVYLKESMRAVIKLLIGTEGRTRTDTMSPSPDFESGASTNSATPAHAAIIAKI